MRDIPYFHYPFSSFLSGALYFKRSVKLLLMTNLLEKSLFITYIETEVLANMVIPTSFSFLLLSKKKNAVSYSKCSASNFHANP